MDKKSIKKSYYSINKTIKLFNSLFESYPRCDNIRSECSDLSPTSVAILWNEWCRWWPWIASDDIEKTENVILNEHQIISVDNQDTDEDTNYEDTNYLAYILIFPQSMILFLTQNHYC